MKHAFPNTDIQPTVTQTVVAVEKKQKIRKSPHGVVTKMLTPKALTPNEELFCILYASDQEFFCNGTQSYTRAFNITVGKNKAKGEVSYDAVRARAYELLTKPHILKKINDVYETRGMNDTFVDKQLEMLITQNAELRTKLGAIQEYNKLKQRIIARAETLNHHAMLGIVRHIYDEADRLDLSVR